MTKKVNGREENKKLLLRYIMKVPLRFLVKARDMYVKGMVKCSRNFSYVDATTGACPTSGQLYAIPRSFSVNSVRSKASDDDFKELVRVASLRNGGDHRVLKKVTRSQSVGIGGSGRIEEDEEEEEQYCEFGEDINVKPLLYSRSISHAIRSSTTGVGMF